MLRRHWWYRSVWVQLRMVYIQCERDTVSTLRGVDQQCRMRLSIITIYVVSLQDVFYVLLEICCVAVFVTLCVWWWTVCRRLSASMTLTTYSVPVKTAMTWRCLHTSHVTSWPRNTTVTCLELTALYVLTHCSLWQWQMNNTCSLPLGVLHKRLVQVIQ